MAVYIIAYILIALSMIIKNGKTPEEKKKSQCWFIFFVLFLILALRHPSMGVDLMLGRSYGYLGRFEYISGLSWQNALNVQINHYEWGYTVFNKLLSLISGDSQILLVGCAALSLSLIFYEIYRKSNSPVMSTYIFMGLSTFLLSFSGLRQSIATSICFVAMSMIADRKPIKFTAMVCLACLFHDSSWIFLIAYPIYHFPMKRSWRLLTYMIPPLFYFLRYPLFQILSSLLKSNAGIDDNNDIVMFLVFYLIYIFCCLFSGERENLTGLKNVFFVACCIQAMAGVNSIVMRAGYCFMNSLILLLPMVTGRMRNRSNARILNILIGVCFILFGLYSIYSTSWAQAYPYRFFWQEVLL